MILGYRQDTKQADHAGQKRLFYVNYLSCNKDIWVEKVSSLLFSVFLPLVFPVEPLISPVSMYYSKNHNDVFLQSVWAKYATQSQNVSVNFFVKNEIF